MQSRTGPAVRIVFELEPNEWHGNSIERLWAAPLGNSQFKLLNTPFFAFGVSFDDVVFARERGNELVFTGIACHSGHSTYRIMPFFPIDHATFIRHWQPLRELGCSFEEGRVLAVDIPASTDIHEAYRLLDKGLSANVWDFEEGHYGHGSAGGAGPQAAS